MLILEVARNTLFVCMDKSRRVTLSKPLSDLEQFGIGAGTLITMINGQPAMNYIAAAIERGEDIVTCEPRAWEFLLGERTVQVALFAKAWPAEVIRVRLADSETTAAIVVDIDKGARSVVVGEVLGNLNVPVGAVCVAINDTAPYEFLEGGLPNDKILRWEFSVGEKTVPLALVFTDENGEYAPVGASVSDAANRQSADSFHKGGIIERPGFVTGIPFSDHSYHERPPRKVSVEYVGSWGQNMGPDVDPASRNDGRSFTLPKQRAPLYDR